MLLLGSMTINGKLYTVTDCDRFIQLKDKNIPSGYYGGRVDKLAKTNTTGIYMCMEGMTPIDLLIDTKEATKDILTDVLDSEGIEYSPKNTKAELIELLK